MSYNTYHKNISIKSYAIIEYMLLSLIFFLLVLSLPPKTEKPSCYYPINGFATTLLTLSRYTTNHTDFRRGKEKQQYRP